MEELRGSIDLTSAGEEELCSLVGVGPALARRIVEWRTDNGGFTSVEQLAQVKGVAESKMALLRPQVVVRQPEPGPEPRARRELRRRAPFRASERAVPADPVDDESLEDVVLSPTQVRSGPRRALARRRLPAVIDVPGSVGGPDRRLVAFLRDNTANLALVGLAVACQLLVIALIFWVL